MSNVGPKRWASSVKNGLFLLFDYGDNTLSLRKIHEDNVEILKTVDIDPQATISEFSRIAENLIKDV